jgi:selenocysteine lyase/cysteine desulfurase
MAETLRAHHGIVVAVRSGRFRISPYLHNTPEDIQTLIQGLKEVIKMESEQLSSPHSVASTDLFEL